MGAYAHGPERPRAAGCQGACLVSPVFEENVRASLRLVWKEVPWSSRLPSFTSSALARARLPLREVTHSAQAQRPSAVTLTALLAGACTAWAWAGPSPLQPGTGRQGTLCPWGATRTLPVAHQLPRKRNARCM